jgi:hypothetical protein
MKATVFCSRCCLSDNIPTVTLDGEGVCNVCRDFEVHGPELMGFFKPEAELDSLLAASRTEGSKFDVLVLFSGGKDSSYVLAKMVEKGLRVLTFTFDNGFTSPRALENIRRASEDLKVENVMVTSKAIDEVYAESLRKSKTVCSGCFRALTSFSTQLAMDRNIRVVMTGLSRGQICETKLGSFFSQKKLDLQEIETSLQKFRKLYHLRNDRIKTLIQDNVMADEARFDQIQFVDYFRYSGVSKAEVAAYLRDRCTFWQRPSDTGGCSTNCQINDAGIYVHLSTRGYHNYAIPLAWDVRLGIVPRAQAIDELQVTVDEVKAQKILSQIGYQP